MMILLANFFLVLSLTSELAWSKSEIAYKTARYQEIMNIFNTNPTIDDVAAQLAMQSFDLELYPDILSYTKKINLDPKRDRIKIRHTDNRIFLEGIRDPIVVGNSEALELFYQGERILIPRNLSFLQKMKSIDKFFSTHKIYSAANTSTNRNFFGHGFGFSWSLVFHSLFPDEVLAETSSNRGGLLNLASGILDSIFSKKTWFTAEEWQKGLVFRSQSKEFNYEFSCILDEVAIKRGTEYYSFGIKNVRDTTTGKDVGVYAISYEGGNGTEFRPHNHYVYFATEGKSPGLGGAGGSDFPTNDKNKEFYVKLSQILLGPTNEKNPCAQNTKNGEVLKQLTKAANLIGTIQNGTHSDPVKDFINATGSKNQK